MAYFNDRAIGSSVKNPFLEDNEIDDFQFLSHPHQGSSGYMLGNDDSFAKPNPELDQRRRQLLEERKRIEERTLQSSHISLGLLHESEQVGIQTAEELIRQREQLQNVEHKVDEVNSTLRTSQKHLNVMKSIFGGIKSYFSSNTVETNPKPLVRSYEDEKAMSSKLNYALDSSKDSSINQSNNHPALRLRGIDTSGFKEEDEEKYSYGTVSSSTEFDTSYRNHTAIIDQKLDNNLDELNLGLGRLKNLAVGLGDEIEEQNETLDRLTGKVERADVTLRHQNRQINRILKK